LHLVGGDFNLPLDASLDTSRGRGDHISGKAECIAWLTALRVVDAWRVHHPSERLYSGPGRINRLDYIFADHELVASCYQDASYAPNHYAGDHLCHTLHLSHAPLASKGAYWQLPRELLSNPAVVNAIKVEAGRLLDKMNNDSTLNYGAMWYGWLKRMKGQLQRCHRQHLAAMKSNLNHLHLKLLAAQRHLDWSNTGVDGVELAQHELNLARAEYHQHLQDRQFDFHANTNERGSAHFFRRPMGSKVPITTATVGGTKVTAPSMVQTIFTDHWKSIMVSPSDAHPPNRAQRRAVIGTITRRLTPAQREELDKPITADELCGALKTMNPRKSPGPDGWSAGFFQTDPQLFSEILLRVFNYQLTHHGRLLDQQRRSAVALLFKSGDRGDPGNFRPIALMPVEVKVGVKQGCPLSCLLFVLYLEPLGEMLRAQPHLGLSLPNSNVTSIFFADDSTLLSSSVAAAMEQMTIVQQFCAVSGARLNVSKCKTLVLNDHLHPTDVDGGDILNILPTGVPVKYLGLLFGHAMPTDHKVNLLNDKFLACFQHWGCRARTLQGRKLLVNTVMLSLLWHVTAVVPVPAVMVAKWQSMVNKFIIGRKTDVSAKYRPLLHRTWIHHHTCGLNVPHVASKLRSQCLHRLQQLMHGSSPSIPMWRSLVLRQFRRMMGHLFRPSHPFDFLLYYPNHNSKWLHLWELHPMWLHVWSQWASIPMNQRIPTPPPVSTLLVMPVWLSRYPLLTDNSHHCAGNMVNSPQLRQWCMYGAANGFYCLRDFLLPSGAWPNRANFMARMSTGNPATRLEIGPHGNIQIVVTRRMSAVYQHLTRTYHRVICATATAATAAVAPHTVSPPMGSAVRDATVIPTDAASIRPVGSPTGIAVRATTTALTNAVSVHPVGGSSDNAIPSRILSRNTGTESTDSLPVTHPFVGLIKDTVLPFESWPQRYVCRSAYHAPDQEATHPMATTLRDSPQAISSYVRLVRRTCRIPPPVHADVWFRLLFHMLPVNSRFGYLQASQPNAICCAYGCDEVETQLHAFYACPNAFHGAAWECFGVDFSWSSISDLEMFMTNHYGPQHYEALYTLWSLLCSSMLHSIWTQHNFVQYEKRRPIPTHVWVELSFQGWTMSIRRWLRLHDPSSPARLDALNVLKILQNQTNYRSMWERYPYCLRL
ncbi:hypothetical protein THRCLA_10110, partial [Thraustotheca clavata]